jgi:hypothetical protein
MKKYLIELQDGGIIDIKDDYWTEDEGCETCGYGGWHVEELKIIMDDRILKINMGDMYDWNMPSYDTLIKWFDARMNKIKSMTKEEFINFIKQEEIFYMDEIRYYIEKELSN